MGVFRIDSMTQVMILMMQESVDKLRAFLIQHQEECWMAMAILLTATLLLLIKRRRKIEELRNRIGNIKFLDARTKRMFIKAVTLSILDDFLKMIHFHYQNSHTDCRMACINRFKNTLYNDINIMHRDRIFEEIDGVVKFLEENYFPQNMSDGQIRDLFVHDCSILRDLKQIPLDNYRGELFFSEVLQEVVQKLPVFRMEVGKVIIK